MVGGCVCSGVVDGCCSEVDEDEGGCCSGADDDDDDDDEEDCCCSCVDDEEGCCCSCGAEDDDDDDAGCCCSAEVVSGCFCSVVDGLAGGSEGREGSVGDDLSSVEVSGSVADSCEVIGTTAGTEGLPSEF